MLEEMALSHIEAESSTLKHLERGNHSDCDSDNDSENKMTSVAIWILGFARDRLCGSVDFNLDSISIRGTLQESTVLLSAP